MGSLSVPVPLSSTPKGTQYDERRLWKTKINTGYCEPFLLPIPLYSRTKEAQDYENEIEMYREM